MTSFFDRFAKVIKATLTGFDRIVFKGSIRCLQYAEGAMDFLYRHGIRNKDFKKWAIEHSKQIISDAETWVENVHGQEITQLPSSGVRKETCARERQEQLGVQEGLIGIWSCQETARTFRSTFNADAPYPLLRPLTNKSKHLYFYFDHPVWGFASVRLQTWFPYPIQIALNGREHLRRALERKGIEFIRHGNKLLDLADSKEAQQILNEQCRIRWGDQLNRFLPEVFPAMQDILGPDFTYYWTVWQSEWATDYLFESAEYFKPVMDNLARHAFMTGTGERVMRYLARPVRLDGQPYRCSTPELMTRIQQWDDGIRIRHWADGNSVKAYGEHNALRVESTMDRPEKFKVFRRPEGSTADEDKKRMPLRKGVADLALRAQVSNQINERFLNQMATLADETPVDKVLRPFTRAFTKQGRRVRGLDLMGKDHALLLALGDPKYALAGVSNSDLREALTGTPWAKGGSDRQLSACISRHLRLLREHGILRKIPNQRRYQLSSKGRQLTASLQALLGVSTQALMKQIA